MTKKAARVLVVEDEIEIALLIQHNLATNGYEVYLAHDGEQALKAVADYPLDVILLDLNLPDSSGLEICKEVREQTNLPIIVLSVENSPSLRAKALNLCADDFVSKPFSMDEVRARIRVQLLHAHRMHSGSESSFTAGPLRVDFLQRSVEVNGQKISLTPNEYNLLTILIVNRGRIMPYKTLLEKVWGNNYDAELQYVHVYINRLRTKIEKPTQRRFFYNEQRVGYRFDSDN